MSTESTSSKKAGSVLNGGLSWPKLIAFSIITLAASISTAVSTVFIGGATNTFRPDPFMGGDAELLRLQITRDWEKSVGDLDHEMKEEIRKIRSDMPPNNTRIRIRALEKEHGPEYMPPTEEWN